MAHIMWEGGGRRDARMDGWTDEQIEGQTDEARGGGRE